MGGGILFGGYPKFSYILGGWPDSVHQEYLKHPKKIPWSPFSKDKTCDCVTNSLQLISDVDVMDLGRQMPSSVGGVVLKMAEVGGAGNSGEKRVTR